jgi:hypothetical protein
MQTSLLQPPPERPVPGGAGRRGGATHRPTARPAGTPRLGSPARPGHPAEPGQHRPPGDRPRRGVRETSRPRSRSPRGEEGPAHRHYRRASGPVLVPDGLPRRPHPGRPRVGDREDLNEAEGSSQAAQGRWLVRIGFGHDPSRLPPPWLVSSDPEVQIHPAALKLKLVDLALAVVLTASLEREHLGVAGERLEANAPGRGGW